MTHVSEAEAAIARIERDSHVTHPENSAFCMAWEAGAFKAAFLSLAITADMAENAHATGRRWMREGMTAEDAFVLVENMIAALSARYRDAPLACGTAVLDHLRDAHDALGDLCNEIDSQPQPIDDCAAAKDAAEKAL